MLGIVLLSLFSFANDDVVCTTHLAYGDSAQKPNSELLGVSSEKPVFASDRLETISTEKVVEILGSEWYGLYDWSFDGRSIIIGYDIHKPNRTDPDLAIMTANAEDVKKLDLRKISNTIGLSISGPPTYAKFSPSGDRILFDAYPFSYGVGIDALFIYNIENQTLQRIVNSTSVHFPLGGFDWMPDGNLVYVDRTIENDNELSTLWLIDPNGNKMDMLYSGSEAFGLMDISPDGEKILFIRRIMHTPSQLVVFDIKKNEFKTILEEDGIGDVRWSPNGKFILYQHAYGYEGKYGPLSHALRLTSVDGSLNELLYDKGDLMRFVISSDGKFIMFALASDPSGEHKLVRMELTQAIPEFSEIAMIILASAVSFVLVKRLDPNLGKSMLRKK